MTVLIGAAYFPEIAPVRGNCNRGWCVTLRGLAHQQGGSGVPYERIATQEWQHLPVLLEKETMAVMRLGRLVTAAFFQNFVLEN